MESIHCHLKHQISFINKKTNIFNSKPFNLKKVLLKVFLAHCHLVSLRAKRLFLNEFIKEAVHIKFPINKV